MICYIQSHLFVFKIMMTCSLLGHLGRSKYLTYNNFAEKWLPSSKIIICQISKKLVIYEQFDMPNSNLKLFRSKFWWFVPFWDTLSLVNIRHKIFLRENGFRHQKLRFVKFWLNLSSMINFICYIQIYLFNFKFMMTCSLLGHLGPSKCLN